LFGLDGRKKSVSHGIQRTVLSRVFLSARAPGISAAATSPAAEPQARPVISFGLSTDHARPILDASIIDVTRPLTEFRIDKSAMMSGTILFDWRPLEQSDGAKIQLIYEGNTTMPIRFQGVAVGQKTPSVRTYQSASVSPAKERFESDKRSDVFGIIVLSLFAVRCSLFAVGGAVTLPFTFGAFSRKREKEVSWSDRGFIIALYVFWIAVLTGLIAAIRQRFWHIPPFGL
jgi:hypothetical protein